MRRRSDACLEMDAAGKWLIVITDAGSVMAGDGENESSATNASSASTGL